MRAGCGVPAGAPVVVGERVALEARGAARGRPGAGLGDRWAPGGPAGHVPPRPAAAHPSSRDERRAWSWSGGGAARRWQRAGVADHPSVTTGASAATRRCHDTPTPAVHPVDDELSTPRGWTSRLLTGCPVVIHMELSTVVHRLVPRLWTTLRPSAAGGRPAPRGCPQGRRAAGGEPLRRGPQGAYRHRCTPGCTAPQQRRPGLRPFLRRLLTGWAAGMSVVRGLMCGWPGVRARGQDQEERETARGRTGGRARDVTG